MNYDMLERIQKAVAYIREGKLDNLECGRHELFDGIYVNVSKYQTKESGLFEAHRKYIDIHYLLEGSEIIEITDVKKLKITKDYDDQADALLGTAEGSSYLLKKGQFMVVFPEEAHMPGIKTAEDKEVKKAVVKVPV